MKQSSLSCIGKFLMLLALALLSLPCHASKWTDRGNYDISWFDNNQTDIEISTPQQLAGMAYIANQGVTDFKGKTIHITCDLNMAGHQWVPIATGKFGGNLKGNGNRPCIKGLQFSDTEMGFFNTVSNITISNVGFQGRISGRSNNVGLVAREASNCIFEYVKVEGNITYDNPNISTSSGADYKVNIGSLVGKSQNCQYSGVYTYSDITLNFASTSKNLYGRLEAYLGGIVGKGEYDQYTKCEALTDFESTVYGYVADGYVTSYNSGVTMGGIVGYAGSNSKIISCLGSVGTAKCFNPTGTYTGVAFQLGGIVGKMYGTQLENCVGMTCKYNVTGHDYSWVAAWYHASATFGGIGCEVPSNYGGCYSNSDVEISVSKVMNNKCTIEKNGSTAFSILEMHTQEFVDELNLYSQVKFGTNNWILDEGCVKPNYIPESGVRSVKTDEENSEIIGIYDINGHQLQEIGQGVNILRYSNGTSKKIIQR